MGSKLPCLRRHPPTELDIMMKLEGQKIDPNIAEVTRAYRNWPDVYATGKGGVGSIYKAYFARNPDGPWVYSGDIPSDIWKQILGSPKYIDDDILF